MKKQLQKKLRGKAGETLTETLVALLIASLALVMLAGAISSASGVVTKSRDKLGAYYAANEASNGLVKRESGGNPGSITLSDPGSANPGKQYDITYYENEEFSNTPVIAYKKSD